jgi:hypothetical protein
MVSIPVAPSRDEVRLRPAPVRWTALRYELPADDSATRARLWRALRGRHALNLRHGLWAVPHRPGSGADLDDVLARLRSAGARAEAHAVDRHDDEHQQLLARACDRLWSDFATAADRLARVTGTGAPAADRIQAGLPHLHEMFRQNRGRDLVQSLAGEGAAQRLDDLEWMAANVGRDAAAPDPLPAATGLELAASLELHDGSIRAVALVAPAPGPGWGRAFAEFERAVYLEGAGRTVVRHGTVVVTGDAAEVGRQLDAVVTRLGRFQASHL